MLEMYPPAPDQLLFIRGVLASRARFRVADAQQQGLVVFTYEQEQQSLSRHLSEFSREADFNAELAKFAASDVSEFRLMLNVKTDLKHLHHVVNCFNNLREQLPGHKRIVIVLLVSRADLALGRYQGLEISFLNGFEQMFMNGKRDGLLELTLKTYVEQSRHDAAFVSEPIRQALYLLDYETKAHPGQMQDSVQSFYKSKDNYHLKQEVQKLFLEFIEQVVQGQVALQRYRVNPEASLKWLVLHDREVTGTCQDPQSAIPHILNGMLRQYCHELLTFLIRHDAFLTPIKRCAAEYFQPALEHWL